MDIGVYFSPFGSREKKGRPGADRQVLNMNHRLISPPEEGEYLFGLDTGLQTPFQLHPSSREIVVLDVNQ